MMLRVADVGSIRANTSTKREQTGVQMSEPFKGVINTDIRDSEPDRTPFEAPRAAEGAPSVLYIALDDVGFSAIGCYGGR
jgi:hypothetical protein